MATLSSNIMKLLQAINFQYDEKLLYNTSQFYSKDQQRAVTMYIIKKAIVTEDKYTESVELFKSTYRLHILLFLRDYLYELEGKELPTDDEKWNEYKARYAERRDKKCQKEK